MRLEDIEQSLERLTKQVHQFKEEKTGGGGNLETIIRRELMKFEERMYENIIDVFFLFIFTILFTVWFFALMNSIRAKIRKLHRFELNKPCEINMFATDEENS